MTKRLRRVLYAAIVASLAALAISGAAGDASPRQAQQVIDIYSSMPLRGASRVPAVAIVRGIRLALKQAGGHAGPWAVRYMSLDDSTVAAGKWDPAQCAGNARRAAADANVAYYIGEFNSGCSEISIPILNQAGIAQVSPDNTYDGLTVHDPGTAPGEPQKYYPTGVRTYLRLSALDTVQAAALLTTMRRDGCAYARALRPRRVDCFMFAGIVSDNAVRVTEDVGAAVHNARLYGADGICTTSFTDPREGGIPASLGRRFKCTNLVMPLSAYPGGRAFGAAYKAAYGTSNPGPYAIYGYEAMRLGLDTIAGLGTSGNSRARIVQALFAITSRRSVIGTYGFDRNGDTTLRSYGLYRIRHGRLVFVRNVDPS